MKHDPHFVAASDAADRDAPGAAGPERPLRMLVAAAFAVGLAFRLLVGWRHPLWFDETFTAVIATQPDLRHLLHWCLTELTGPVYYGTIWAWEKLAGDGDLALRLPSLACSTATPFVAWRFAPMPARRRLLWAALLALWLPGMIPAGEARPYALLVLLATGQAAAFVALLRSPGIGRALGWVALSSLAVLCHYHALVVTGFQGLIFLAARPRGAIRSWPAVLGFVPLLGWMAVHLPFVLRVTAPANSWYQPLGLWAVPLLPRILLGLNWAVVLLVLGLALLPGSPPRGRDAPAVPERLLALSGLLAVLVVLAIGVVRPTFTARYILPFGPALLAGVALWLERLLAVKPRAAYAVLACAIAAVGAQTLARIADPAFDERFAYSFEPPSTWLRQHHVRHVTLLWDNPVAAITPPDRQALIGGYFLRRDGGRPVPIGIAAIPADADPNPSLLAAVRRPGDALIWAYDLGVPGTRGALHPTRLAALDPGLACRDFGVHRIHMVACIRPLGGPEDAAAR